ncbi:MAG: sensor histidine kinase [Bryobacteraceae bacterium]|jgi:two-component system NarL family sensor kinase
MPEDQPVGNEGPLPDAEAWVDMLARMGGTVCRLQEALATPPGRTGRGQSLLAELERERSRIARELHAGAGQPLAGIKLNLELLGDASASMPGPAREALSRLRVLTDAALDQVRAVSHRLHPPEWQDLSTERALRNLVEGSGLAERFETVVDIERLPKEPGHAAKVALYRCAQECIANIFRHSQASRVEFRLRTEGDTVGLRVSDNGKGIAADAGDRGIGLRAMREHVALLGGAVVVDSESVKGTLSHNALQGTTITVSLPLAND